MTVDLQTGVDLAAVAALLDDELATIRAGTVEVRAIERAIRRREAGMLWRLDGVGRRAAMILGAHLSTGSARGIGEALVRMQRVTPAAVTEAARRWLDPARMVEVVTRPGRGREAATVAS